MFNRKSEAAALLTSTISNQSGRARFKKLRIFDLLVVAG
jgi:hypothetical protein